LPSITLTVTDNIALPDIAGAVISMENGTVTASVQAGQDAVLDPLLAGDAFDTLIIQGPGTGVIEGLDFLNNLEIASGGSLLLQGGTFDIADNLNGAGSLTLGTGSSLSLDGTAAATESLLFNAPHEILILGTSAEVLAPISGLTTGDVIALEPLEGQQVTSAIYDATRDTLAITGSGGAAYTLTLTGIYQQSDFAVTNGEVDVTCFLTDTRIASRSGEVCIQDLAIGDLVRTESGDLVPVKWIGRRRIDCSRHPDPRKVWPVCVCAGAFGEGLPSRDLWLSPDHAVYANDVLIPIKHLINGMTIEQVPMDEMTYYHIELDQHDVLLAEGLPAESYLDTGDRSKFSNGGGPIALYPDFSVRMWEAMGCAPLVVTGPALASVRTRLLQRAAKLAVETDRQRSTHRKSRAA
jgi:hypothetical protein